MYVQYRKQRDGNDEGLLETPPVRTLSAVRVPVFLNTVPSRPHLPYPGNVPVRKLRTKMTV
jgi:hypothetical protein